MKIIIRNVADVPNKYVRLLKWKLHNLSAKFKNLVYIEAFINLEGKRPVEYRLKLRLGIPGHDIITSKKVTDLEHGIHLIEKNAHMQLSSSKDQYLQY